MYLPQPDPDQELIILDAADRIAIMAEDTAIRYHAARESLIERIERDSGPEDDPEVVADSLIEENAEFIKSNIEAENALPLHTLDSLMMPLPQGMAFTFARQAGQQ